MTRTEIEKIKDQIKQVLTLKDIVEHYVGLPNQAGRYKCPFNHEERQNNLEIKNGYWRCYSCNESGDEIEFVWKMFGLNDYKETLIKIAQDFNLDTTNKNDPEYLKRINEIKAQRELEKQKQEERIAYVRTLYDKIVKRNLFLEEKINEFNNVPLEEMNEQDFDKNFSLFLKVMTQKRKNDMIIDILSLTDQSGYGEFIFGSAYTEKEKVELKDKIIEDFIEGRIKINEKGDVVRVYGKKW